MAAIRYLHSMQHVHPDTVILLHRKESPKKCTVAPLRGRPRLQFYRYPPSQSLPSFDGYVRLGIGGPTLSEADSGSGLLLLDASWRHAAAMETVVQHLPVRGLPPLRTAYPRVSNYGTDPEGGLATVEALYAAHLLLGRDIEGLLDLYRWRDEFLSLNRKALLTVQEITGKDE